MRLVFLSLMCLMCSCSYALRNGWPVDFTDGALAEEVLHVVSDEGIPIAGVAISGGFQTGLGYRDFQPIRGVTDAKGVYVARGRCTGRMRLEVSRRGYYATELVLADYGATHHRENGKWLPFGEERKIVLKKIRNPQPLVVKTARNALKVPRYNDWLGFDLERYDFVAPVGKGRATDLFLRFSIENDARDDYHMTFDVSFVGIPFAGAYEMAKEAGSEFESVYRADTNAVFRQTFAYRYDRHPNAPPRYVKLQKDKYLVFRTRTTVDDSGRLLSAHYGKICGEWNFVGPAGMSMDRLVFNATPNDTNLEDRDTADRSHKAQLDREDSLK